MKNLVIALSVVIGAVSTVFSADTIDAPFTGTFEVVTIRNASDVASQANPMMAKNDVIGQEIIFTEDGGLQMQGLGCDHWEILLSLVEVVNLKDPMLSDIHVAPTDSPLSAGDQRIGKTFHYQCEGEEFMSVHQVDERVLVIPWKNSSQYLIAEKPLSEKQVNRLQAQLKDMKFHHSEPTGILDDDTMQSISAWMQYRLKDSDAYRFKRTAITENLLDTLGVLD